MAAWTALLVMLVAPSAHALTEAANAPALADYIVYDETSGPSNWYTSGTTWMQTDNIHAGTYCSKDQLGTINYITTSGPDYEWSVDVASQDNDAVGLVWRVADTNNFYKYSHTNDGGGCRTVFKIKAGARTELWRASSYSSYTQSYSTPYEFKVVAQGCRFVGYYNGAQDFDITDSDCVATGGVGLYAWGNSAGQWSNMLLTPSATPSPTVSQATTAHYALSGSWYGETIQWTYSTHGGFMGGASGDRTVYCMDNGVVDATAVDGSVHTMGTVCCQPDGVGTRSGCVSGTYETAAAHCESVGQALCTVEQIKAGSGEGSGCSFDDDLVWTSNGCTPTTASPTPTPPDAASATGDPHLSNIRGEHFDVYQPGNMALIHVPRRAEPARTLLLVEAEARRMGDECSVYFQGVTISGLWTNQSKPIQFLASSRGPPEGRKWKEWVRFGSIDLKVVRRTKGVDYLNVYIRNLGRTSYEVGGLLGLDDHSTVAKRPRQCAHRHAAMLESSVADAS